MLWRREFDYIKIMTERMSERVLMSSDEGNSLWTNVHGASVEETTAGMKSRERCGRD